MVWLLSGFSGQKLQRLLREELNWDGVGRCQEGFWLSSYSFIVADSMQVVSVNRQLLDGEVDRGPVPMVIFEGVVELGVDKDNKIVWVDKKERLGVWLDVLSKIVKDNSRKS